MIDNHEAMGKDSKHLGASSLAVPMALNYHAKIVYHTAELAEVSSYKVEMLTRWLVGCTIALIVLTIVLAVFTWMLVKHGN